MGELSAINRVAIGLLVLFIMVAAVSRVRKRELSLSTAVLWLFGGAAALLILLMPGVLTFVTEMVGAKYPASALTLYAFVFFGVMMVILTARLEKTGMLLTQVLRQLAILERRIRHLEQDLENREDSTKGKII